MAGWPHVIVAVLACDCNVGSLGTGRRHVIALTFHGQSEGIKHRYSPSTPLKWVSRLSPIRRTGCSCVGTQVPTVDALPPAELLDSAVLAWQ
jgi:hypothetical protein